MSLRRLSALRRVVPGLLLGLAGPLILGCVTGTSPENGPLPSPSPPVESPEAEEVTPAVPPATLGRQVFVEEGGCGACHTINGLSTGDVGPDLSNIGNKAGGRVAQMSAREYLAQSIRFPEVYVATQEARGVPDLMTRDITDHLTPEQVDALVAFLLEQKRPDYQEPPEPTPLPPPEGPATISVVEDEELGQILTDGQQKTVYLYGGDGQNESACFEECARVWPPVRTDGDPVAGAGVDAGLLGTIGRPDGLPQVTYAGWPLYYFVHDSELATVSGHEIQDKWGLWLALSPSGEPAQSSAPATPN